MSRQYPARPIPCAGAVILRGNDVLLIRRAYPPRPGIWTFPGGAIELGETAREACAREVLEETGLQIRVGPVVDAVDIMEQDGDRWRHHFTVLDFLAEVVGSDRPAAASDAGDAAWVALSDIGRYGLTPLAAYVLERALWMRAKGQGPLIESGERTVIGG